MLKRRDSSTTSSAAEGLIGAGSEEEVNRRSLEPMKSRQGRDLRSDVKAAGSVGIKALNIAVLSFLNRSLTIAFTDINH